MATLSTVRLLESASLRKDLPEFRVGDTVAVHYKIVEGDKLRVQVFRGIVLKRHRAGLQSTFTVRKVSFNVGVERIFMQHSPRIEQIEVQSKGVVRRGRLYYLRDLTGKAARVQDEKDR
jgi:large subunit ribosomal protein L19